MLFCGSKKSLVSGVPMAGALFPPAQVGMIILPLMIFHQLQLFVCAWLANRLRRQGEAPAMAEAIAAVDPTALPRTEADIDAAAAKIGIAIPEGCKPGVAANLELLGRHADRLVGKRQT